MFLVEAIIALTVLLVVLSVGLLLLKFVFTLVLIPIKIAFFLTKGLLGLLLILPLLLVMGALITAVLPLALVLLALPALLLGGIVCAVIGF